jgi:hypothetical protein
VVDVIPLKRMVVNEKKEKSATAWLEG